MLKKVDGVVRVRGQWLCWQGLWSKGFGGVIVVEGFDFRILIGSYSAGVLLYDGVFLFVIWRIFFLALGFMEVK